MRRPAHSRHSLVPADIGMGSAVHGFGGGQELSAAVLRAGVPGRTYRDSDRENSERMTEARTKIYLLDVEGTVAPLTLTTEVLFPYARAHFESFLKQNVAEIERKGN